MIAHLSLVRTKVTVHLINMCLWNQHVVVAYYRLGSVLDTGEGP